MNILFVYPTLFHPQRGGIERVTDSLAREMKARGHNIFYLHNKPDECLMDFDYPTMPEFFPHKDYKNKDNRDFYIEYLKHRNINIIINQCGAFNDSSLYCHRKGTKAKVLSVVHTNPLLNYNNLFPEIASLKNISIKEHFKRAARILIYAKIKKDYLTRLKSHYEWLSNNNHTDKIVLLSKSFYDEIKFIYPPISQSILEAIGNPNSYKIEQDLKKEKVILFVGRFDKGQKRPDRMIRIWKTLSKKYPDWKLIMIGDGPQRNALEHKSRNISNIEFLGFQNPEPYYRRASLLCMTSNFEGFGIVLTEAMSKGCVPIAFNSFSSISDIIKNESQLVTPFSISEYISKLSCIIDSNELFQKLQDDGYKSSYNFTIETIVDYWEALINKITV